MKEIFDVGNVIFVSWIVVDVLVVNVWMVFFLYGVGQLKRIDEKVGADT